jgi:YVTN family beta-propeller protein
MRYALIADRCWWPAPLWDVNRPRGWDIQMYKGTCLVKVLRIVGIAVGALTMALACGAPQAARADGGAPNLAYVTGAGVNGDEVAVIDIAQRKVTGHIAAGGHPTGIVLSADNRYAYVTRAARNDLAIIDAHALTVSGTVPTGAQPQGIAIDLIDSTTPTLFIANAGSGTVSVVNPDARQTLATVPVGRRPQGIAFAGPSSGVSDYLRPEVYVANTDDNTVNVIDARNYRVLATVAVPDGPVNVTIPATNGVAYVTTRSGAIAGISLADHRYLGTLFETHSAQLGVMDYDAVTTQVYVPDGAGDQVVILAPASASAATAILPPEPARALPIAGAPAAVAITFDGAYGFVAQARLGQVTLFDPASRQTLATIAVGGTPRAIITGAYPPLLNRDAATIAGYLISGAVLVISVGVVLVIGIRARRQGANHA